MKEYRSLRGDLFIAALIILVLYICFFIGCATREPASTDHHYRVPRVTCTNVKYKADIRQVCCLGEKCWFN